MKTIVSLVSVGNHGPGPFPIYGPSGRSYGHARFDPQRNRHVFELSYEEYLKIGPHIAANATDAFTQWFAEFRVEDGGEDAAAVRAQLEEVTGQRDALQKREDDRERAQLEARPLPVPLTDSASAPARTLDGAVEVLQLARDLPALAEDKVITLPDGSLEKQHQEIHPVQAGSPIEDYSADNQTGKTTTREQITSGVEVITEHEKVDAAAGDLTLADSVRAHLADAPVENHTVAATTGPTMGAAAAAGESSAEVATELSGNGGDVEVITDFRTLREIAKEEGVPDLESHVTPEDMRAAILLNREERVRPAA